MGAVESLLSYQKRPAGLFPCGMDGLRAAGSFREAGARSSDYAHEDLLELVQLVAGAVKEIKPQV